MKQTQYISKWTSAVRLRSLPRLLLPLLLMASQAHANVIIMGEGDSVEAYDVLRIVLICFCVVLVIVIIALLFLLIRSRRQRKAASAPRVADAVGPFGVTPGKVGFGRDEDVGVHGSDGVPPYPPPPHGVDVKCGPYMELKAVARNGRIARCKIFMQDLCRRTKGDYFVLGRSKTCDFIIDDMSVSRLHAQIRAHDGKYCLGDIGSSGGTYFEGRRLEKKHFVTLHDGDKFTVGKVGVEVKMHD